MFEGFELSTIDVGEAAIRVRVGGEGPPLLLLHGYPQTHAMWHRVAPRLAQDFTVVAADLRGYGDSSKPTTTSDHEPYSKRAMARDQIQVMQKLGFGDFHVVGHDRGARCAYRMALDHPERVRRLAVLDIIPTSEAYRRTDMSFALGAWHWFLLPQPYDLPERLLGADPEGFYFGSRRELFAPQALDEYLRCLRDRSRSMPSARTTGRARQSTSTSMRPTAERDASRARCWCSGASVARSAATST